MGNETTVRYFPPSKYDVAKFGTILKVMGDNDSQKYFVQMSENESTPDWKLMEHVLLLAFEDMIDNKDFRDTCLTIITEKRKENYEEIKKNLFIKLAQTLQT